MKKSANRQLFPLEKINQPIVSLRVHALWCAMLAFLVLLLFRKYLVTSTQVLSSSTTDIASQMLYSYAFGFDGLKHGHLIFWNPYVYGGQPFLGQFQSALLYPINWLVMCLPNATALNWLIFIHLWILGAAVYGWSIFRGVRPLGAFVSGTAMMFGGSYFLHIYGGHLTHLCSMALAPLVFWGIDGWIRKRHAGWLLLAAGAAAMQIYAGHPQVFYYTAIATGVYSAIFLWDSERLIKTACGLLAIYPLALLLAAAQLLPGLAATTESVRAGGTSYGFASMFSLPWSNLLTLIAPWFFGDLQTSAAPYVPYWGSCYLWEMELYASIGVLALAVSGFARLARRRKIQMSALIVIYLLLALGARTPLYHLLYAVVPGYDLFRVTAKFAFFMMLFIALLAGHGLHFLFEAKRIPRRSGIILLVVSGLLFVLGLLLQQSDSALTVYWHSWLQTLTKPMGAGGESYLYPGVFNRPDLLAAARHMSADSLLIAGCLAFFYGVMWLIAARKWKPTPWIIALAICGELLIFAHHSVTSFPVQQAKYAAVSEFYKNNPGDYRVLDMACAEEHMIWKKDGAWGYDPFVLKRYAEYMYASQGLPPDDAGQYLNLTRNSPMFALLRIKFAFLPQRNGEIRVVPLQQPFPRFFFVSKYEVLHDRDTILQTLADSSFHPKRDVILEQEPQIKPDGEPANGQVHVKKSTTDEWDLSIDLDHPAILVMTDAYSKDWHATALPGRVQKHYQLLPADYAVRGIPLMAGHHELRIAYTPAYFYLGVWLSLVAWGILIALFAVPFLRRRLQFANGEVPLAVDG